MSSRVLVSGGAGFIGSHLCAALLERGYEVRALDALASQVHGGRAKPLNLPPEVEFLAADVRDRDAVRSALDGIDAVVHLAAAVGVGQSMYEIAEYTSINDLGTAILLEELVKDPVRRLICASSMSVYGEGLACLPDGSRIVPADRSEEQLRRGEWEPKAPDGLPLVPLPTPESKPPSLSSVYALNKYAQERLCLMVGRAYGIPTLALRFFNVYGPHQALSNPYTGVLAIFAARLINGRPPLVFEDGHQRRDFVHVRDVARACILALETEHGIGGVFNIGSGESRTILSVAEQLATAVGRPEIRPHVTGKFRTGDIRHCFADIEAARTNLLFEPRVRFEEGLRELAEWLREQSAEDRVDYATDELEKRGLVA